MYAVPTYPERAEATLGPPLGGWLWLVKWLLAVPNYRSSPSSPLAGSPAEGSSSCSSRSQA